MILNLFHPELWTGLDIVRCSNVEFTVQDTIDKLAKLQKSPRLDLLHPTVLCETCAVIAYPLFLTFKKSISAVTLPSDWKLAEVTIIHKKDQNQTEKTTYRYHSI